MSNLAADPKSVPTVDDIRARSYGPADGQLRTTVPYLDDRWEDSDHLLLAGVFASDEVPDAGSRVDGGPWPRDINYRLLKVGGETRVVSFTISERPWPRVYTLVHSEALSAGHSWKVYHRLCDGLEGWGNQGGFDVPGTVSGGVLTLRIRGAQKDYVRVIGSASTAEAVTPPPLDGPWIPARYLFVTLATAGAEVTGYPEGWTATAQAGTGPAVACAATSSIWDRSAAPGPFTLAGSTTAQAVTFGFYAS